MTPHKKIWVQNFHKLLKNIKVYELSFPNQFDIRKFSTLNDKEDKTAEEKETLQIERNKLLEIVHAYRNNQRLAPDVIPESFCTFSVQYKTNRNYVFPPMFELANGYILVTEELYHLLKQFELGSTQLLPVTFYDLDLETRFDDKTYYLLNVCEPHQYFLPEIEKEKRYTKALSAPGNENLYFPPDNKLQNQRYYFSQAALNCPVDLWYDPNIVDAFFMSDRLVKAIKKAGMQKILSAFPCQIVE